MRAQGCPRPGRSDRCPHRRRRRSCRRQSPEKSRDLLDRLPRGVGPRKPEAGWLEHAAVRLEHEDVVGQLVAIALPVIGAAAQAVFLVGEQDDADGAPGSEPQLFHEAQRFPAHDTPAAVVGGAGPDVPGVEVAADDDDLVGQLASADLSDQVEGVGVGKEPGSIRSRRRTVCRGCASAEGGRRPPSTPRRPGSAAGRPRTKDPVCGVRRPGGPTACTERRPPLGGGSQGPSLDRRRSRRRS